MQKCILLFYYCLLLFLKLFSRNKYKKNKAGRTSILPAFLHFIRSCTINTHTLVLSV